MKTELKHGDKVKINFGIIENIKATVLWIEHTKEGPQIWLTDVEKRMTQGHSKKFIQHIPSPCPINWITKA